MFCVKCGKEIQDESAFCKFCGAGVQAGKSEPSGQARQNPIESTIPIPAGVVPISYTEGVFVVSNMEAAFRQRAGQKFGVMSTEGKMLTPLIFKSERDIRCTEGKALILPADNGWALHDMEGKRISKVFSSIAGLGHGLVSVSSDEKKEKFALADLQGSLRSGFEYDLIRPFSNGYAVFMKDKKFGAMDPGGNIVVKPRFAWLGDGAYGQFRFSSIANPGVNAKTGLVDASDRIVLTEEKGYSGIESYGENVFTHSITYSYEIWNNNKVTTHTIAAKGYYSHGEVIEAKYLFVGEESEGLRAFVSYTQSTPWLMAGKGRFVVGYMDEHWNNVIVIAEFDAQTGFEFSQFIHRADFSKRLTPFRDGRALVAVQGCAGTMKNAFMGLDFIGQPRWIDKKGNVLDVMPKENIPAYRSSTLITDDGEYAGEEMKKLAEKLTGRGYVLHSTELSCGLVCVWHRKTKLYGYADESGALVVDPIYEMADPFKDGFAWARQQKGQYLILRLGKKG